MRDLQLSAFGHVQQNSQGHSQNIFYYIHDEDILLFVTSMRNLKSCRIRVKEELLLEVPTYTEAISNPEDYVYLECDITSIGSGGYKIHFRNVSIYFQVLLFFQTSLECVIAILKLIYTIGYISMDVFKGYFGSKLVYVK